MRFTIKSSELMNKKTHPFFSLEKVFRPVDDNINVLDKVKSQNSLFT